MTAPHITLQLFAKAPVPGAVKTRLVPALSPADAAVLHARLVERAAAAIADAQRALPNARAELWCAPDCADPTLRAIAGRYALEMHPQRGDDLGARMRAALTDAMPGMAILAGSDCPLLDVALFARAIAALAATDAVFVPVEDGGYALIGCRGVAPPCFDRIAWSTPTVMRDTRERLARAGTRWVELPVAWDVDRPADLERLAADPRTASLVSGLGFDAQCAEGQDRSMTGQRRSAAADRRRRR